MTDKISTQQYAAAIYQCAKSFNATYYSENPEEHQRLAAIHNADIERTAKLFGVTRAQVIHDSTRSYEEHFEYLREVEGEEAKNRGKWSLRAQICADRLAEQAAAKEQAEKNIKKERWGA